jgi:molybdate transport system substrate-binding protein
MKPIRLVPLLLALLAGCGKPAAVEVYAAASTKEAMERLAADFQTATGVEVRCSFGASSTLARQIENGAPADLFLSADEEWVNYLSGKQLVAQRRDLLANRLVVVAPADGAAKFASVADVAGDALRRLAVAAEPVPAGRYARQALRKAGVWDAVRDHLVEGGDVRATLRYVEQGEADAGFVYATDARVSGKVRVALVVPEGQHDPIIYPLASVRRDRPHPAAARFADYLAGDHAASVFRDAGFRPLR